MKAMIFAAGLGTRLRPFTDHHPKALAIVNGKTLLEYAIRYLQKFGITDVVINVHHFANQIEDVLQKNKGFGSKISISDEREQVLETGGGLKQAAPFFGEEKAFVLINVDVLTELDLSQLIHAHQQCDALATLAVMQRTSSRNLLFDEQMTLCGWKNETTGEEKTARATAVTKAFAFSGVQVVSNEIFSMPFDGKFSIIDVYLHFAAKRVIHGYDHTGDLFIDVGRPESLGEAGRYFAC